ncbi:MAG TPA: hypothetical protein DEQ34_10985 [Balneolaceae bacterium]|nr:hypothetical protein [Balneolaceae bacterium]|tara:strand:- start:88729 stop:89436 length:708 start_codon:yes stop_codon:yes gene_type:complete
MPSFIKALKSQVGRKYVTGITGVFLMLFLIGHLGGNLTIFAGVHTFNNYTHHLENLGPLLYVIELVLAFLFIYHAVLGISIARNRKKARPESYNVYKTKGGPSHQTLASRSMAITGVIILVFLVIHIWQFKFGFGEELARYTHEGVDLPQLRARVIEAFTNPVSAFGYAFVLAMIILHLSHGFWSAFTSLGMKHGETSKKVQAAAYVFAIVLMLGFMFIPLYIFFTGGDGSLISY